MIPVLTQEQKDLADLTRRFLADTCDHDVLREGRPDPQIHQRLATELGVVGLRIPEELGGAGFGMRELALVLEEVGRALAPVPLLASAILAAGAIHASGDAIMAKELLPRIAQGVPATFAWEPWPPAALPTATPDPADPTRVRLQGGWDRVWHGADAPIRLVLADGPGGLTLYLVEEAGTPALAVQALETLDPSRPHARLTASGLLARPVGRDGDGAGVREMVLDEARTALSAELLGVASACLDAATDYARTRVQFGRAIGSFQAVKHRCADMLVAVESARSAVMHAALVTDTDPTGSDARLAAPVALATAIQSARFCARSNIQVHGGIGCTWEHDAHLYYRRAEAGAVLLGSVADQHQLLADRLDFSYPRGR